MTVQRLMPATLAIKAGQPVPYLYNHLIDCVKEYKIPANFKNDEVVFSTFYKEQKESLIDKLMKIGISFIEK